MGHGLLADYEDFPHVVSSEEEFDRGKITEEGFDVAIVEDALQTESIADSSMDGTSRSTAGLAP